VARSPAARRSRFLLVTRQGVYFEGLTMDIIIQKSYLLVDGNVAAVFNAQPGDPVEICWSWEGPTTSARKLEHKHGPVSQPARVQAVWWWRSWSPHGVNQSGHLEVAGLRAPTQAISPDKQCPADGRAATAGVCSTSSAPPRPRSNSRGRDFPQRDVVKGSGGRIAPEFYHATACGPGLVGRCWPGFVGTAGGGGVLAAILNEPTSSHGGFELGTPPPSWNVTYWCLNG